MSKLKTWQEQLQDMVDKGIDAAENAQKQIAAKPFQLAERVETEVRQHRVKNLRKRYDGVSGAVFDQLRSFNNRVGNFAADLVARLEKETAETARSVSKTADEVADDVSSTAKSAASEVSDTAQKSANRVSRGAQSAAKDVSSAADSTNKEVSKAAQSTRKATTSRAKTSSGNRSRSSGAKSTTSA